MEKIELSRAQMIYLCRLLESADLTPLGSHAIERLTTIRGTLQAAMLYQAADFRLDSAV